MNSTFPPGSETNDWRNDSLLKGQALGLSFLTYPVVRVSEQTEISPV